MSSGQSRKIRRFCFGEFEFDVRAGELRKHGIRLKLREQPSQILQILLEHPAEVVLRDEIRQRLWPNDTVVEFDHGINVAIQRIRDALGESAESPRFIETVARRGYRFLGEVERVFEEPAIVAHLPATAPVLDPTDPQTLAGRTISHYRILHKLGEGGMGVVYRAEDLKLGRSVALKVLSCAAGEAPEAVLRRFEREARAASALNHPNICTIYGLENLSSQPAIVMEFVAGETLAARLRRERLPQGLAVHLAQQIAEALAEAHSQGIVHRDVKPSNIMLTGSETRPRVKVLDFGLAKVERSITNLVHAETVTQRGTLVGTLQYMSPEQLQAKEVDARSDIFSFGVVFYEMLTGQRPFDGDGTASVIAGILERNPAPVEPRELNRIIQACLAKNPKERFQSAQDLKRALEWSDSPALASLATPSMPETVNAVPLIAKQSPVSITAGRQLQRRRFAIGVAAVAIIVLGILAFGPGLRPKSVTVTIGSVGDSIISPEGTYIVYGDFLLHRLGGPPILDTDDRRLDKRLPTHDPRNDEVAWSPDGSQILFRGRTGLWRMSVPNGPLTLIWPKMSISRGYSWGPDGSIICAVMGEKRGLYLIRQEGGVPRRLEIPGLLNGFFFYPEFLPDGRNILFGWMADDEMQIGIYSAALDAGRITRGPFLLRRNMSTGHFSPSNGGMLLYVDGDTLFAEKLNLTGGKLSGRPKKVVDPVYSEPASFRPGFSVSRNGVLAWRKGHMALARLTWFDRRGRIIDATGPLCYGHFVFLAPDDSHILFVTPIDNAGSSIAEANRSGSFPLVDPTVESLRDASVEIPIWMPRTTDVVYRKRDQNSTHILRRTAAGGPGEELTRLPGPFAEPNDISPDAKYLLYAQQPAGKDKMLYAVRLDGGVGKPEPIAVATQGRFSPDGKWVVYLNKHVFVQPFPPHGPPTQIDEDAGFAPVWRGDGREILYLSVDTIYSVQVEVKKGILIASAPQALFKVRRPGGINGASRPLAVTNDGQRILFAQGVEQPSPQLSYAMTAWDSAIK